MPEFYVSEVVTYRVTADNEDAAIEVIVGNAERDEHCVEISEREAWPVV